MQINSAKDLDVYKKAYFLAMKVFELSKMFPSDERFALTSQIRRSSRSTCLNLREAWAKRKYEAHFVSKLTDCDGENAETESSIDFAKDCGYVTDQQHAVLTSLSPCRQWSRSQLGGATLLGYRLFVIGYWAVAGRALVSVISY